MKKVHSKLSFKLIISFILLGAMLCAASATVGYYQFKDNIQQQYNTTAYQIADQAQTYLDKTLLQSYVSLIKKSIDGQDTADALAIAEEAQSYQDVLQRFFDLRTSMGANDIFLVYIDQNAMLQYTPELQSWRPVYYLFDSFENEDQRYGLGEAGPFNPKFIQETQKILETGIKSNNYFISSSSFGYNTSAMQPIKVGSDTLLLGVEVPMTIIQDALLHYLLWAIFITIVVISLGILLYVYYLTRNVIRPINTISKEARAFIQDGKLQSRSLSGIKTGDEIQNLAEGFIKMQDDINNYVENITKITSERERLSAELDVAKHIQASMLPCIFPAFPERNEFDIYASMTPAKEVGGDFYDFFLVDDDHLALVIADVSGKGVPAALFMMISKMLIKNAAQNFLSPKKILETANNQLCENNEEQMFVTVWLGIMEISTGKIICSNAGHEYPAIYRKNENFSLLQDKHGFVLAGMENVRYREYEIQLNPGDVLYVYTDGVAEATDKHEKMYGTDRMISALNQCACKTPLELDTFVRKDIDQFVNGAEQFDDITMLCIRYFGNDNPDAVSTTVDATVENWEAVSLFLETHLNNHKCSPKALGQITVAAEEIYVNIANYAYGNTIGKATITISFLEDPATVKVVFEDHGTPYDPMKKEDPDITLSAEERDIGGLGIFMTKKLMDKVTYRHMDGKNILTIFKRII